MMLLNGGPVSALSSIGFCVAIGQFVHGGTWTALTMELRGSSQRTAA
jgi:hypothetical protein